MSGQVAWYAVKGKVRNEVLRALELKETERFLPRPGTSHCGVPLGTGWYLLYLNDPDEPTLETAGQKLSAIAPVVACELHPRKKRSACASWKDGQREWSVSYDGRANAGAVQTAGSVPRSFAQVKDEFMARQGSDHIDYVFEIPLQLARQLTGFKHDEDFEGVLSGSFEVLEPLNAPEKPWWKKLLGL